MIHSPNDESEVFDSSHLTILKAEMERYSSINNIITDTKFELVETLLKRIALKSIVSHIYLKIFLTNFYYHTFLYCTIQYVTENMIRIYLYNMK